MGFPDLKQKKLFKIIPMGTYKEDGWEDLGEFGCYYDKKIKCNITINHKFCGSITHIGKEDEKLFKFCPLCKILTI